MHSIISIIDADGLLYHSSKGTLEESIEVIDDKIQNIFTKTSADAYMMFLSQKPYFRSIVYPDYKIQRRKYKTPLKWLKSLRAYLIEQYGANYIKGVEADDLCNYWMNVLPGGILCSPDKDLLKSINGNHFNYTYTEKDKGFWIETEYDEDIFVKEQMVVGDATDNVKGIEGKGKVYWESISNRLHPEWEDILYEYILKYNKEGIHKFYQNYVALTLLKDNADFERYNLEVPNTDNCKIHSLNTEE